MKRNEKRIEELATHSAKVEEYASKIEANFAKTLSLIEYRLWQYNTTANTMLYELIMTQKKKKPHFHPLVSIIIPVYNGSNYLKEAVKSTLSQTYDNIEIIIVNDGSTDSGLTDKVATSFKNLVRYYKKPNGGVSSALNYGIKRMKGDYFAWLSHDDLIAKDHIEKLVEWLSYEDTDFDIPFSSFNLIDEKGNPLLDATIEAQLFCNDFKISYYYNELSLLQGEINGGSVLIPKKAFDEFGLFDESQKITQERDFWDRLMAGYHFVNIPYDTASIRCHSKQVSNTKKQIIEETNQKNLSIINHLSEKRIRSCFDNELLLLEHLKRFYNDNGKQWLKEEVSKMIETKKTK